MVCLEKKRLWAEIEALLKYMKGCCKEEQNKLSLVFLNGEDKEYQAWITARLRLSIRLDFPISKVTKYSQGRLQNLHHYQIFGTGWREAVRNDTGMGKPAWGPGDSLSHPSRSPPVLWFCVITVKTEQTNYAKLPYRICNTHHIPVSYALTHQWRAA